VFFGKVNNAMKRRFPSYIALVAVALALTACGNALPPGLVPEADGTRAAGEGPIDDAFPTRTPEPTATAGSLARGVENVTASAGLSGVTFLGLTTSDWMNLGLSLILVLLGFLFGTLLVRRILPPLAHRTPTKLDDRFLAKASSDIRWLVVVLVLHFATRRLTFIGADLKDLLYDVYFVVGFVIGLRATWWLVDLAAELFRERARQEEREDELAPVITLLARVARILLVVAGLAIFFSHFGVNVTVFAAALALGLLAFSLGARDTIADAIAGFIILVDRPFRIGDRIEIQGEGTWGDVVEIGLRTTRVRTRDNRLVIVPNSLIGQNQVVNFTYPDPRYRIETRIGIAYGTDIGFAEQIIIDSARKVDGVLADYPVEVLYDEMGDWAMVLRVRWWIESYVDTRQMYDRVHRALQEALDTAGIEMPYPTQTLHVEDRPAASELLAQTFEEHIQKPNAP
jgi:MscS family membrane protein